ncbi:CBS domain-containing protein [Streptomyces sp. NPDC088732]|uniref:CBS domain-containing protein n=1 Tax=Streptomyces sp. NPDC088732 TaxID=3365879 RepID=UPI00382126D3
MKISAFMNAPVATVSRGATARQAALRMRDAAVGSVLVTEADQVLGVVTDRDLAVRCLASGGDPDTPVSELMSAPAVTVDITDDVSAAYRAFRRSGVRRLPVVDGHRLVGMVTVDNLFLDVFQRLTDLLAPTARTVLKDPPDPEGMQPAAAAALACHG